MNAPDSQRLRRVLMRRMHSLFDHRAPVRTDGAAAAMLELARGGPAPLAARAGRDLDGSLKIAAVVPSFRRGGGGHRTIVRLLLGLRDMGHEVSAWLDDHEALHAAESSDRLRRSFARFFDAADLPFYPDLREWRGADVVMATGWQTVPRALMLPEARARAYLVQDHEPDFYPASAEATWAAQTYSMGLHCIAASPWLAQLLRDRYRTPATHFDLGVDHSIYQPAPEDRRDDLVIFYARATTPRRAVPLGLTALAELAARRPSVRIELFGEDRGVSQALWPAPSSPCGHLGVLAERELAALYSRATIGLVFSLTNPSLIGPEMMACGLPCVELATPPMTSTFGSDGPLQLAEPGPLRLCAMIERLLDDSHLRARLSSEGLQLTATRSWPHAAEQVETALRKALQDELSR